MNLCFDHFNLVAVIFQENIADIADVLKKKNFTVVFL